MAPEFQKRATQSIFSQLRAGLALSDDRGIPRLRAAQHGAVLAGASHFTRRSDAGIVALPTAIGKTLVMQLLPFMLASERALVIVPGKLLREQVADQLADLSLLANRGVLRPGELKPKVALIEHEMHSPEEWRNLADNDFVVSTPRCISGAVAGVCPPPADLFDTVFVDEAHHAPAATWRQLLHSCSTAQQILLTATPYRNDETPLPGVLIYDYPMTLAIERGELARLSLEQINFDDTGDPDLSLIRRVRVLVADENSPYYRVPFIARTNKISSAKDLAQRYRDEGVEVAFITSEMSLARARSAVSAFKAGNAQGLVIVGMLAEGFDFPAIKIAAYHRPHLTLPAALQFFGRVSRSKRGEAGPSPLLLVPEHEAMSEVAALYRENADWGVLVPSLADRRVEGVRRRATTRAAIEETEVGAVSDEAVQPRHVVDIFELAEGQVPNLSFDQLPQEIRERAISDFGGEAKGFIAYIESLNVRPDWLGSSAIKDRIYELNVAVYCIRERLLIVSTPSNAQSRQLARWLLGEEGDLRTLPPETFFGLIDLHDVEAYFSLGTRNAEDDSDARPAYVNRVGKSVAGSLTPADREGYRFGHANFRYVTEDGTRRAFGIALRKSRAWSPEVSSSLSDFVAWCRDLAQLIERARGNAATSVLGLRETSSFSTFPEHPCLVSIPRLAADASVHFLRPGLGKTYLGELTLSPRVDADRSHCTIQLTSDDNVEFGSITLDPTGSCVPNLAFSLRNAHSIDDLDARAFFESAPPSVYFADGSSVRGPLLTPPRGDPEPVSANVVHILDWNDVATEREKDSEQDARPGIFTHMQRYLQQQYPQSLIINDDGHGEIADIIVVQHFGGKIIVRMFHCKGAQGAGRNLQDLYEVIGQAERSTWWTYPQRFWREAHSRFEGRFRIIQCGDRAATSQRLEQWAQAPPQTEFEISIVQPGISAAQILPRSNVNIYLLVVQGILTNYNASFGFYCRE
jgi:superfamily II DNA or RNA helicase